MRIALARKEQELLMLQRKKIEMELEQTKKQLEMAEKTVQKVIIVWLCGYNTDVKTVTN